MSITTFYKIGCYIKCYIAKKAQRELFPQATWLGLSVCMLLGLTLSTWAHRDEKKQQSSSAEGQSETAIKKLEALPLGWREVRDEYLIELTLQQIKLIKEAQNQSDVYPLPMGKMDDRQLKGGESILYVVELTRGQVLKIDVQEKGVDVKVVLIRVSDKQVIANTDFGWGYNRERQTTVIDQAGSYALVIVARQSPLSGGYQLTANVKEAATESNYEEIQAEQLLAEGLASRSKRSAEDLHAATAKWEEALLLWKKLGETYWEGFTMSYLGLVYSDLSDNQKALKYYSQALPLRRAVDDKSGEATTLTGIGLVYYELGDYQQALAYYQQVLPLRRAVGDKSGEANALTGIGGIYSSSGEKQKALEYYNQALPLTRAVADKDGEANTLHNMAEVYSTIGEKQKALEYYNQALPLRRLIDDKKGEAQTLGNIGKVYSDLGEEQKALDFFNEALRLSRLIGYRAYEAYSLHNIGGVYYDLGEKQKALQSLKEALPIFRLGGSKSGEAYTLTGIGLIHDDLGKPQMALDFFYQALPLHRSVGDKIGEAGTLNNIGGIYYESGEKQKALEVMNNALSLFRGASDKSGEATTLSGLGAVYSSLGERQKALEVSNQALSLRRIVGDPNGEGITLGNLMAIWIEQGQLRLATFYGKQSINAFQQIRANIQSLDKGIQKSFLISKETTYRNLAELLISQNRLQEAAQILDLLKLQEFSDFINRSGSPDRPTAETDFSQSEAEKRKQYDQLSNHLFTLNTEYNDLANKKARTSDEELRLKKLEQEIDQAKQQFQQFIAQLPDYFSKPETESVLEISGIKPIVRNLGAGTAALYTLMADAKYYVILISQQTDQARHYTIKRSELEKKVKEFKLVLQTRERDPRPAAQELYQILLAPIEKELQQAKVQTLMWSLDGALRYLPMSALYDGKQYLVEKYQNVVIDPTSQSRLREQPASSNWRGVGMGTSKAYIGLKPLSNVPEELDEIIREAGGKDNRGVIPGEMMLNDTFTETSMFQALKRNYKVVHIASHFVLSSKDARESYLLLGNGEQLKLSQISEGAKIFDQVDLVVLSACDTASGGEDADGREVDAFGIITQQKGAKAVLASLWPVVDESTKEVMVDFYQRLRGRTQVSKAEALRQAQLRLLRGEVQKAIAADNHRGDDKAKKAANVKDMQWEEEASPWPEYKVDPKAPYGHPYYWAPFILIGNWR